MCQCHVSSVPIYILYMYTSRCSTMCPQCLCTYYICTPHAAVPCVLSAYLRWSQEAEHEELHSCGSCRAVYLRTGLHGHWSVWLPHLLRLQLLQPRHPPQLLPQGPSSGRGTRHAHSGHDHLLPHSGLLRQVLHTTHGSFDPSTIAVTRLPFSGTIFLPLHPSRTALDFRVQQLLQRLSPSTAQLIYNPIFPTQYFLSQWPSAEEFSLPCFPS